jgi:hypothetical protein
MGQEAYERAKAFSNTKLEELRLSLKGTLPDNAAVITFGSYARREASPQSDIDYIVLNRDSGQIDRQLLSATGNSIEKIVELAPSEGGAFAKSVTRAELLTNVGGNNDTNENLTRRLLLMLEGEWLTNGDEFKSLRSELISLYIRATPRDHQLALFLLNDIIRYWRTMTVDYMYKTTEDTKPWGIRNIKLIFSRKLMYASGLFSVGLTADKSEHAKHETLSSLFDLPALERIVEICGNGNAARIKKSYNYFLEYMELAENRSQLKSVAQGDHDDPIFREIKNEGHNFTRQLLSAFESVFHSTHPIRRAVIF